MKAVAYYKSLPITERDALQDINLPEPVATGRDLLVAIQAISVNPVDCKIRIRRTPPQGQPQILGWDAAGVVQAVGPEVRSFKPGDRVWYAGDLNRAGSNAELQLVDERIVGHMPKSLDFAAAAALPLTTITAWEMLFDRLQIPRGALAEKQQPQQLLVIGAAGGVGSILIQLARRLTSLTVIGTASRPESHDWVKTRGAHHVIRHDQLLAQEFKQTGLASVTHVASLNQTESYFSQLADLIAPQGKLALIDDLTGPLDIARLKSKSISLHWEFMFTRSLYQTEDMLAQQHLLNEVAELVDAGIIQTTLNQHLGTINAENLKRAHALQESGKVCGKIVLEGF